MTPPDPDGVGFTVGGEALARRSEIVALVGQCERLEAVLLSIATTDWHYRSPPRPQPDGGLRGWAGHRAALAVSGLYPSTSGDDKISAALAEAQSTRRIALGLPSTALSKARGQ